MIDDALVRKIRDSLLRMAQTPARVLTPTEERADVARTSIRLLARSRVSAILRQLRAAHGLTYEQIHEQTGLAQQVLFDVEFKERRLTLDELRTLAMCYGVGVNDILGVDVE
jgi:hypothetical protein